MRWTFLLLLMLVQWPFHKHWFYAQEAPKQEFSTANKAFDTTILPAADQFHKYYHYIKDKRLGLVVNHTAQVGQTHLVDTLLNLGLHVKRIFAPEHGFRGTADAGEQVKDGIDLKTKLPIISLYGKNKKPTAAQFEDLDLIIFDIQDVGTRFYTYTSTMTYIMEACAMHKVPLLILDRPNPNGHYIDGPILKTDQKSFVGLHPVPIVHGLTVAEYARMINGEGWLSEGLKCELYHVECLNYDHNKYYKLPIKPSPNLPNMHSIYLYPSLCWFEGTCVSVGRGTKKQFQIYGHPECKGTYKFKPSPMAGARHPKHQGKTCYGTDLSQLTVEDLQKIKQLNLDYLCQFYQQLDPTLKASFFNKNNFFDKLAGCNSLQQQLKAGMTAKAIRASWQEDLKTYQTIRKRYLLYPDFDAS